MVVYTPMVWMGKWVLLYQGVEALSLRLIKLLHIILTENLNSAVSFWGLVWLEVSAVTWSFLLLPFAKWSILPWITPCLIAPMDSTLIVVLLHLNLDPLLQCSLIFQCHYHWIFPHLENFQLLDLTSTVPNQ